MPAPSVQFLLALVTPFDVANVEPLSEVSEPSSEAVTTSEATVSSTSEATAVTTSEAISTTSEATVMTTEATSEATVATTSEAPVSTTSEAVVTTSEAPVSTTSEAVVTTSEPPISEATTTEAGPTFDNRITSLGAEVFRRPKQNAVVSSIGAEVFRRPKMGAHVSSLGAEVLRKPHADTRVSTVTAEVLWLPTGGTSLPSEAAIEFTTATGAFSFARPTDVDDGDLIAVVMGAASNSTFAMAGWTQLDSHSNTGLGGRIYTKVVTSGDTSFSGTFGTGVLGVAALLVAGRTAYSFEPGSYTMTNIANYTSALSHQSPDNAAPFKPQGTWFAVMLHNGNVTLSNINGLTVSQQSTGSGGVTLGVITGASYGGAAPALNFTAGTAGTAIGWGVSGIPTVNFG